MQSHAYADHLLSLLADAAELSEAHKRLRTGVAGRQWALGPSIAPLLSYAFPEAYVEEIAKEGLEALRPQGISALAWTALKAPAFAQIKRFNTPDTGNTKQLLAGCIGIVVVTAHWRWQKCSSANAREYLDYAIMERHKVAHGVNPRPTVNDSYSGWLPSFFRNLARCTDRFVSQHVANLGGNPSW